MKVTCTKGFLTVTLDDGRKATVKHNQTASGYSENTSKAIWAAKQVAEGLPIPTPRIKLKMPKASDIMAHEVKTLRAMLTIAQENYTKAIIAEHKYKLGDMFINLDGEIAMVTQVLVKENKVHMRVFIQDRDGGFATQAAYLGSGRWAEYAIYKGPTPRPITKRKPKAAKVEGMAA